MTFLRLRRGHLIAALAALALLFAMALDWSSTDQGEEARRIESAQDAPAPGVAGEVTRDVTEDARIVAEGEERNAWQPSGGFDYLLLVLLVASAVMALAAAAIRATGRTFEPPLTPSVVTAAVAAVAALVAMIWIIQVGAIETGGQVGLGAPLGLLAVGAVAVGAALAARAERAEVEGSAPAPLASGGSART